MDTTTRINTELIKGMHRIWLEALYPIAGKFREMDLSKSGFTFFHALYIPNQMARFEVEELASCTPCEGDLNTIARKIATVHAELLMIHPFREGNGRLARWLADLMSLQAGFPAPYYDLTGARRQIYFAAVRRGFLGDTTALTELFASSIALDSQRYPLT